MVHTIAFVASLSNCWAFSVGVAVSASVTTCLVGVCADGILMYRSMCFGGSC